MSKQKTVAQKTPTASKNTDKKQSIAMLMQIMPIILIAAIVPIIVQMQLVGVPDSIGMYWNADSMHVDFFSKSKATYIMVLASLSVLILIGLKLTKLGASSGVISLENRTLLQKLFYKQGVLQMERVILVPIAVYTLFTMLSAMFSEYKEVALNGFPDRYEGLWVLLAYIAIWGTTIALVKDIKQINWIVAGIVFSGIIMCVVGITQYMGNDIFQTDFGKALIVPDQYSKIREDLSFNMAPGTAYSTLFNTNNVGSMMSMLGIFGIAFALLSQCIYARAVAVIFSAMTIFTLLASNSRGGYLGATAGIVFLAIMLLIIYKLKPKYILIAGIILIIPVLILTFGKDKFSNLSRLSFEALVGAPTKSVAEMQTADTATAILGFTTQANTVEVRTNAGDIYITYLSDDTIEIRDKDNNIIQHIVENKTVKNTNPKFSNLTITMGESDIDINLGYSLKFAFHENEMWFVASNGYLVKAIEEAPVYPKFLETYGKMGSSRGIIWGKTIPLLKDTLFIGKGPDNFAMYYPQDDYTSKIIYFRTPKIIVDKPHNQYIQIALNQGVISLLAFLLALAIYYFWSIRNIIKRPDVERIYLVYNTAFGAGMMSYLVAGMFNDSIVSVAPIFWIMWGLGVAVNCMISNKPIEEN